MSKPVECGYPDPQKGPGALCRFGPALRVNVGFDLTYKPSSNKPPTPGKASIEALVDTGADEGCIDTNLAAQLKLPIVDRRPAGGALGGIREVNVHLAQIHIPALRFTLYGLFSALQLNSGGIPQPVLLGRTFLQYCQMHYDGRSGSVTIKIAD